MARLEGGRSLDRAFSVLFVVTCCFVRPATLQAQSPHPFAAPSSSPLFSMGGIAALADVNRDGTVDVLVPGFFFGTLVAQLDEDGGSLANNIFGPNQSGVAGVSSLPRPVGMAGGDMDGDGRQDVITVTNNGTVHFHRNLGATSLAGTNWAADVIIDDFHLLYPIAPPFQSFQAPVVDVLDFDLDGHLDVVLAASPIDYWSGSSQPGFVGFYRGNGSGAFQVMRHDVPGSVIDVEAADLDNDGVKDAFVVLVETGSVGVFGYELHHLSVSPGGITPWGPPQSLAMGRLTALELADVAGDSNTDYLLAQVSVSGGLSAAAIYYLEGDGMGHASSLGWGTLPLPANATGMSDFITSMQVADFNHDSHLDIAVLRGFVMAATGPSPSVATYQNAEVLIGMGPSLAAATMTAIPLPGSLRYADSPMYAVGALPAQPDGLRCCDFDSNSCADLLVTGLRDDTPENVPMIATIKNLTAPAFGDAGYVKVGEATGGVTTRAARIGFEGGLPRLGNSSYACTIQNVQGGCVVGLMWSQVGIADLFATYGFTFHMAPEQFGYANLAAGTHADDGFYSYELPIPNDPNLIGDVGCFQYCYFDHVAGLFGGTQATCVRVGN
jgi:hypothetical protein